MLELATTLVTGEDGTLVIILIVTGLLGVMIASLMIVQTVQLARISREVFLTRVVPEIRRLNEEGSKVHQQHANKEGGESRKVELDLACVEQSTLSEESGDVFIDGIYPWEDDFRNVRLVKRTAQVA